MSQNVKVSELLKRYEKGQTNAQTLSPKGSMIVRERGSSTLVKERAQSIIIQGNKEFLKDKRDDLKKEINQLDEKSFGVSNRKSRLIDPKPKSTDSPKPKSDNFTLPKLDEFKKEETPENSTELAKKEEDVKKEVKEDTDLKKEVKEDIDLKKEGTKEVDVKKEEVKKEVTKVERKDKIQELKKVVEQEVKAHLSLPTEKNPQKIIITKEIDFERNQEKKKIPPSPNENGEIKKKEEKTLYKIETKGNFNETGSMSPKYPILPIFAFPINKPAIVLFDFIAEFDDEVTITQNEEILVILYDKDWSWISFNYEQGNVPSNYFVFKEDIEREKKHEEEIKENALKEQREMKEKLERGLKEKEQREAERIKKEKEEKERKDEKERLERIQKERLERIQKEKDLHNRKEREENEENEKKENEKKENERKENEKKDNEKKDNERKENERKENEKKEKEEKEEKQRKEMKEKEEKEEKERELKEEIKRKEIEKELSWTEYLKITNNSEKLPEEEKKINEKEKMENLEKEKKEKTLNEKKELDEIKIAIVKDPQLSTKDLKQNLSPNLQTKESQVKETIKPQTDKKDSNRGSIFFKLFPSILSKKDKKEMLNEKDSFFDRKKNLTNNQPKKECEFGINCTRKNPQHWIEYKHTALEVKSPKSMSPRDIQIEELQEENQNLKLKLIQCEELINALEKKLKEVINEDLSDLKKDKDMVRKKSIILKELKTDFERKEDLIKQIHTIKEILPKVTTRFPGYWIKSNEDQIIDIDPNSEEFLDIQTLLNGNNFKNEYILQITNLQRIQKISLWKSYSEKKDSIIKKYNNLLNDFEESKKLTKFALTPCLDYQSNELWLFHGMNEKFVPEIIQKGYDTKSTLVGKFGSGIYLQESSFQAYPYIPCPKCGEGAIYSKDTKCSCKEEEICTLLLFRVILGHSHICLKYNQQKYKGIGREGKIYFSHNAIGAIQTPPIKEGSFETYDCVIGEKKENGGEFDQREYVIYDKDQIYPEYIIKFKVNKDNNLLKKFRQTGKDKK